MLNRSVTNRGSTLVSVLIALALLGFVAAVFSRAFDVALRSSTIVGRTSQALSIGQHKIDQMRAIGYGRLNYTELKSAGVIDAVPTTQPYNFTTADGLTSFFPTPNGTISIVNFESDVRRVTVTITWGGANQTSGDITLTALISRD